MNATDKTYNGWTNYETWNVALWLDNEQSSYNYWRERAQECLDDAQDPRDRAYLTADERARIDLADAIKEELTDGNPLADQATLYTDLLSAALSEVNWQEIARHYLDDLTPTEGDDAC